MQSRNKDVCPMDPASKTLADTTNDPQTLVNLASIQSQDPCYCMQEAQVGVDNSVFKVNSGGLLVRHLKVDGAAQTIVSMYSSSAYLCFPVMFLLLKIPSSAASSKSFVKNFIDLIWPARGRWTHCKTFSTYALNNPEYRHKRSTIIFQPLNLHFCCHNHTWALFEDHVEQLVHRDDDGLVLGTISSNSRGNDNLNARKEYFLRLLACDIRDPRVSLHRQRACSSKMNVLPAYAAYSESSTPSQRSIIGNAMDKLKSVTNMYLLNSDTTWRKIIKTGICLSNRFHIGATPKFIDETMKLYAAWLSVVFQKNSSI